MPGGHVRIPEPDISLLQPRKSLTSALFFYRQIGPFYNALTQLSCRTQRLMRVTVSCYWLRDLTFPHELLSKAASLL